MISSFVPVPIDTSVDDRQIRMVSESHLVSRGLVLIATILLPMVSDTDLSLDLRCFNKHQKSDWLQIVVETYCEVVSTVS
jgi:hypothetical protein